MRLMGCLQGFHADSHKALPEENTGPSHDGADENLSLIVDYNESTRLPSPQSGDEHSALMGHLSPSFEVHNLQEAFMLPDSEGHASSSAPTSAAITNERAASNETAATQQQVGDSKSSAFVNFTSAVLSIHNGESDSGEGEQKSSSTSQAISLARRRKGGYASDGLPPMSPPSKWSRSSGHARVKKQGKALGRAFTIPVVLRSNDTTDEYEAEFLRRVKMHVDAVN
ncbi:unnamed protein product [Peronospora effusa]|nr:unnamed protein product [Peronospora effusa]